MTRVTPGRLQEPKLASELGSSEPAAPGEATSQAQARLDRVRRVLSEFLAGDAKKSRSQTRASQAQTSHRPKVGTASRSLRADSLRLLARREHSAEELRRKLAHKQASRRKSTADLDPEPQWPAEDSSPKSLHGEADAEIETLLRELARQGWQSDQRYAEVMLRRLAGQVSQRLIRERLMQAGVSCKDIERAWSTQAESLPDDAVVAQALWERRYGHAPAHDKERQRQVRYLLGRGFALSLALRVVPKVKHQEAAG